MTDQVGKNYDDDVHGLEDVTRPFWLRGIKFEAKPTMPAKDLSTLADLQNGESAGHTFETVTNVIRSTLIERSRPAWDELMSTELDVPITLQTLMNIADDLVEQATGRPPTQPSPSGSTGETSSMRSTDGSGSTVDPDLARSTAGRG